MSNSPYNFCYFAEKVLLSYCLKHLLFCLYKSYKLAAESLIKKKKNRCSKMLACFCVNFQGNMYRKANYHAVLDIQRQISPTSLHDA